MSLQTIFESDTHIGNIRAETVNAGLLSGYGKIIHVENNAIVGPSGNPIQTLTINDTLVEGEQYIVFCQYAGSSTAGGNAYYTVVEFDEPGQKSLLNANQVDSIVATAGDVYQTFNGQVLLTITADGAGVGKTVKFDANGTNASLQNCRITMIKI